MSIRLRATMTMEYVLTDQEAHENYGTLDPDECAEIDQANFSVVSFMLRKIQEYGIVVKVKPVGTRDEPLSGPYRLDPVNGNAMRVESESYDNINKTALVVITDIFGDHKSSILKTIWESWVRLPDPEDDVREN